MADPFSKYLNKDEQNILEGNKNPFNKYLDASDKPSDFKLSNEDPPVDYTKPYKMPSEQDPFAKYLGKEDILQNKVMTYLQTKHPNVYAIHVPNEGKRTPFMQFKFKYLGGKRGIPDILIFHGNKFGKFGLAIELKVGYNKPTKSQYDALESLKKANWEVHWVNTYEKTIQIIDDYFK